jgi:hypothetical protein
MQELGPYARHYRDQGSRALYYKVIRENNADRKRFGSSKGHQTFGWVMPLVVAVSLALPADPVQEHGSVKIDRQSARKHLKLLNFSSG